MTSVMLHTIGVQAQDDLIQSLKENTSLAAKDGFIFSPVVNLERTEIKNQERSGTCWSYAGNMLLESEMLRQGKTVVDISEIVYFNLKVYHHFIPKLYAHACEFKLGRWRTLTSCYEYL